MPAPRCLSGHPAAGRTLTPEQPRWLDRIRSPPIVNLLIDLPDFDDVPVFQQAGGWANATRAFTEQLDELLRRFKEAVAA